MSYTQLALLGVAGAVLVDTVLLRTWLVRRRTYWTAYAIVLFFQLLVPTGSSPASTSSGTTPARSSAGGSRSLPVEDILFGYAMVTLTLSTWVWLGRKGISR